MRRAHSVGCRLISRLASAEEAQVLEPSVTGWSGARGAQDPPHWSQPTCHHHSATTQQGWWSWQPPFPRPTAYPQHTPSNHDTTCHTPTGTPCSTQHSSTQHIHSYPHQHGHIPCATPAGVPPAATRHTQSLLHTLQLHSQQGTPRSHSWPQWCSARRMSTSAHHVAGAVCAAGAVDTTEQLLGDTTVHSLLSQSAVLAASVSEGSVAPHEAVAHSPSLILRLLHSAAMGQQWVHETTGLPWWASIPLTTWAVRMTLLPFSMWQARTVRTNFHVYREAVDLTDKQLGTNSKASTTTPSDSALTARRGRLLLSNFALLRTKLSAPHPAWIFINPLVQLPVFMLLGGGLRLMGALHWPGLDSGGALWFQDLTQAAMVRQADGSFTLPMGAAGLLLPLTMLSMTLTSLRIGFGASGTSLAPLPQDTIGRLIRILPYVLFSLAVFNTYIAMQLPHAPLLHWLASSSFTLGLQLALQQPGFRAAFNLPTPAEIQASLSRVVNQRLQQLSESGGTLGPGRGYAVSSLPDALTKQVAGEGSADVLVVLGAQHSAQRRYREALYCLDRALQIDPAHVRAHYSRGQVFSLNNRWPDAEACFRRAAELAHTPSEQGQALYCIATALHTQGKVEEAIPYYSEAQGAWSEQPVVAFSLANALVQLGRLEEARSTVQQVLAENRAGAFTRPLQGLLEQIERALQQGVKPGAV